MGKISRSMSAKNPEAKREESVSQTRKPGFSQSINSPVDHILSLQRTIGNQAVQRMFKFGVIQAKLKIGQPGDIYEQEADRVADAVMRMPEPQLRRQPEEEEDLIQTKPLVDQITPFIQRQVEEEEELIQTKGRTDQTPKVTHDLESSINAFRGGGQPLPASIRTFFEPRFGYDFSQVRVHTDAKAAESAQAVNAKAYTLGQDVVFGAEQYAPETAVGRRLLAHELVHTIHQRVSHAINQEMWVQRVHIENDHKEFDCQAYIGDLKLEACLNDEDRLRPGDRGPSVENVQKGLVSDGIDIGPEGADGKFGQNTGKGVKIFKKKHNLGFTQFPDVGPGTMNKLDELCSKGSVPPNIVPPIPVFPQPQIVSGFTAAGTPRTQPSAMVFKDGPNIDTHAHFPQFEWLAHITMSGANTNCFEAGFLQTITKSKLRATYSSGDKDLSPSTCSFVIPKLPIRDGDSESTTWFTGFALLGTCELIPKSVPLPPGISRTFITSKTSKRMSDDPGGPFPIEHSDDRKKLLRKIEETIDFNAWLAVKQRPLPQNDVKSYHFLKNARWVLERRTDFSHHPSGIGFSFKQNQVTLKSFGDGQGGSAPKLDPPVARKESKKICKL
ncbi:MAG: DUF4157 domain-containing protein [Proteobacteria bacterium]|nr:DUF4157 domain-containing protein [Pseudomonadota bacterium]